MDIPSCLFDGLNPPNHLLIVYGHQQPGGLDTWASWFIFHAWGSGGTQGMPGRVARLLVFVCYYPSYSSRPGSHPSSLSASQSTESLKQSIGCTKIIKGIKTQIVWIMSYTQPKRSHWWITKLRLEIPDSCAVISTGNFKRRKEFSGDVQLLVCEARKTLAGL